MRCEVILYGGRRGDEHTYRCVSLATSTVLDSAGGYRDVCGQHRRFRAGADPDRFVERRAFMERSSG